MNEITKYNNNQTFPKFPNIWDLASKLERGIIPVDSLFDDFFNGRFPSVAKEMAKEMGIQKPFSSRGFPKMNVAETPTQYEITAEIAGLEKKDISVELDSETNVLTISGKKVDKKEEDKDKTYLIQELKQSSFSRSICLGGNCNQDTCKADFSNGILKITIDKKVEEKPKNTKIKVM